MTTSTLPAIRNNVERQQYELELEGQLSVLSYFEQGDVVYLTHTGVPPSQRGRGVAAHLVKSALDDIRSRHMKIRPSCSYVIAFLRRHPEYNDLLSRPAN
jgi:predicted GNAT family acetyltransferase